MSTCCRYSLLFRVRIVLYCCLLWQITGRWDVVSEVAVVEAEAGQGEEDTTTAEVIKADSSSINPSCIQSKVFLNISVT